MFEGGVWGTGAISFIGRALSLDAPGTDVDSIPEALDGLFSETSMENLLQRSGNLPGNYPGEFLGWERTCKYLIYWRSLRDSNPCYSLER